MMGGGMMGGQGMYGPPRRQGMGAGGAVSVIPRFSLLPHKFRIMRRSRSRSGLVAFVVVRAPVRLKRAGKRISEACGESLHRINPLYVVAFALSIILCSSQLSLVDKVAIVSWSCSDPLLESVLHWCSSPFAHCCLRRVYDTN
jgi:hypothetical protein